QHGIVLRHDRDHHGWIFRALAFVDRRGIGRYEHVEFAKPVGDRGDRREELRIDHPNVATQLNNLAGLLQDSKRLSEAELLYRRALAIVEKSYGPDHPSTETIRRNLRSL